MNLDFHNFRRHGLRSAIAKFSCRRPAAYPSAASRRSATKVDEGALQLSTFNLQPSTRRSDGVALVITLILLSVTLVMADAHRTAVPVSRARAAQLKEMLGVI